MLGCTVLALIKFSDVNFAAWNQLSLCKLCCDTVILIQLRYRQSFLKVVGYVCATMISHQVIGVLANFMAKL